MILIHILLIFLVAFSSFALGKEVLELRGVNFELALSSYQYVAILFYDATEKGKQLENSFKDAALNLDSLNRNCEIAKIDSQEADVKEILDAYGIKTPSIKVFRKGIMTDYRGPFTNNKEMASFILEDSKPSVRVIKTLVEMKKSLQNQISTAVIGFFSENEDMMIEEENAESYSVRPWGQFQAAADSMRGHATFYAASSIEILDGFHIEEHNLPVIYMIAEDGDGLIEYTGEILEINISEWVLRNSAPGVGELSLTSTSGEMYTTQFFSSKKLKFILVVRSIDISQTNDFEHWKSMSEAFKGKALFSYMVDEGVADVIDFFGIDLKLDLPVIVAHDPVRDYKYKSQRLTEVSSDEMKEFVAGVVGGYIKKIVKSEPVPKASKSPVKKAVGSTVLSIVSEPEKDVLLELYAPWCAHCKKLRSTYDILGRAVEADSRIVVAKMDGTVNDVPTNWQVKGYPALLWFPAKDKPYGEKGPIPRPYWDAGFSLHEMVSFVQRESSFDMKTLKVASPEQQGQLLSEEDVLRAKYEEEDIRLKRNEGRVVYDNDVLDYLIGDVTFDGKRWHLVAAAALVLVALMAVINSSKAATGGGVSASSKKKRG